MYLAICIAADGIENYSDMYTMLWINTLIDNLTVPINTFGWVLKVVQIISCLLDLKRVTVIITI